MKYINPGYGGLFDISSNFTDATDATMSKTGVCFYATATAQSELASGTKELWAKFDVTSTGTGDVELFRIGTSSTYCGIICENGGWHIRAIRNGSTTSNIYDVISDSKPYTYYLHILSDSSAGKFQIYIDGMLFYDYTGNVLSGADMTYYRFYSVNNRKRFSNIIISDAVIKNTENIAIIPTTVSGTMTDNGDGTYTANSSGETLIQSVNSAAIGIDSNATITGIAIAGIPAYYDGTGISQLNAKIDGVTVETLDLSINSTLGVLYSAATNESVSTMAGKSYTFEAV